MEQQNYDKLVEIEKSLSKLALDQFGRERPDPTPIAPPLGYTKQPSMVDHVRAMVARELSRAAAEAGAETFEEANDFEVGEDYEPETAYELAGYEGDLGPVPEVVAPDSASKPINPGVGGGDAGASPETAPASPTPGQSVSERPASSPATVPAGKPG